MKIDGAKGAPVTRVELSEFFEQPAYVDIRVISPYGKALLREIAMESFEVGELDAKGKTADVKANLKGSADREMRSRDVKLQYTFVGTNIMSEGQPAAWTKPLWDALDEVNPAILQKLIDAIDVQSGFSEDKDPT